MSSRSRGSCIRGRSRFSRMATCWSPSRTAPRFASFAKGCSTRRPSLAFLAQSRANVVTRPAWMSPSILAFRRIDSSTSRSGSRNRTRNTSGPPSSIGDVSKGISSPTSRRSSSRSPGPTDRPRRGSSSGQTASSIWLSALPDSRRPWGKRPGRRTRTTMAARSSGSTMTVRRPPTILLWIAPVTGRRSSRLASAMPSAWRFTPRPASCGRRRTALKVETKSTSSGQA